MNIRDYGESRDYLNEPRMAGTHVRTIPTNSSQQVHVEIDELVLTGFTQSEGRQIAESLRETLAHLVVDDVARWRGAESVNVEALDADKVQVRRTGRAQSTGERVARAIYGSLPR